MAAPQSALDRLLAHFDLLAIAACVVGVGAVVGAGALVARLYGGLGGFNALIIGLLLLAAAAVIAYYVLVTLARQRLHMRLVEMRDAAHELGGGDLSVAVPEAEDDLGALGGSLNTMRERIARLLTAQRELLSGVSHELRSPLARIEVSLELINMELECEDEHELVIGIREEVALLERHISRLLEAQRVSRDRVVLTRRPLQVDTLLGRVIDRERLRMAKLGWRLDVALGAGEAEVNGDDNALDRVFSTLIENAIRHAAQPGPEAAYSGSFAAVPEGSEPAETRADAPGADELVTSAEPPAESAVESAAELTGEAQASEPRDEAGPAKPAPAPEGEAAEPDASRAAADPEASATAAEPTAAEPAAAEPAAAGRAAQGAVWAPSLRIETEVGEASVTLRFMDRGPGLDEEQCARVFEPFFRGDRSRSTATGGTGLGMYLTRNILRAHGGDVLARPRDGGGLVVELRMPLRGNKEVKETMRVQWSDLREDGL